MRAIPACLASLSLQPLDPLFAFLSSSSSLTLKISAIFCFSLLLLASPVTLTLRFAQDAASALGHRSLRDHTPYWVIAAPLLAVAVATFVYFSYQTFMLRSVTAFCPALDWLGMSSEHHVSRFTHTQPCACNHTQPPPLNPSNTHSITRYHTSLHAHSPRQ